MCGIIGISGLDNAAVSVAVGLHTLQHRGQEAAGIISFDGESFHEHRESGLAGRIYTPPVLDALPGSAAIGHVRYSTSGVKQHDAVLQARDAQPMASYFSFGALAIAHNGNITNEKKLRQELMTAGHLFQSEVDTEVALKLIGSSLGTMLLNRIQAALPLIEGAYSLVMLTQKNLVGVRDPLGIRPLVLGKLNGAFIFASETCALSALQADFIREVEPGEIVIVEDGNISSHRFAEPKPRKPCIFEYVYFSRPDSVSEEKNVYTVRKALGRELAKEAPVDVDMIVPIPDSGNPAALGFSEQSGIPFELAIVRNHYVGRVFIQPTQQERGKNVALKLSPNELLLKGKSVVLVDDSLVRGTTAKRVITRLKEIGVREVHLRITSPPWRHGCYYGIDEADPQRRVAKPRTTQAEIEAYVREITGATSVAYLSLNGMYRAVYGEARNPACPQACDACFTGDFPTALTDTFAGRVH